MLMSSFSISFSEVLKVINSLDKYSVSLSNWINIVSEDVGKASNSVEVFMRQNNTAVVNYLKQNEDGSVQKMKHICTGGESVADYYSRINEKISTIREKNNSIIFALSDLIQNEEFAKQSIAYIKECFDINCDNTNYLDFFSRSGILTINSFSTLPLPTNSEEFANMPDGNYVITSKDGERRFVLTINNGVVSIDGIIIANKTYNLPETYTPQNLVDNVLNADAYTAFLKMKEAALKDGINLELVSTYRPYAEQQGNYGNYVAVEMANHPEYDEAAARAAADGYSARPGHSEHQTGFAADITSKAGAQELTNDDAGNPEAIWLANHAHEYGYTLRYPDGKTNETGYQYEWWHFRYVGPDLSNKLYLGDGNYDTLENYYGLSSQY